MTQQSILQLLVNWEVFTIIACYLFFLSSAWHEVWRTRHNATWLAETV